VKTKGARSSLSPPYERALSRSLSKCVLWVGRLARSFVSKCSVDTWALSRAEASVPRYLSYSHPFYSS
jgi:hypothetical protein